MHVLVGWEDAAQSETMDLLLNVDGTQAKVTNNAAKFREQLQRVHGWDVILLSLDFPDREQASQLFDEIRSEHPECPIVGACHQHDIFHLASFLTRGMHSYVIRDDSEDFIFLLTAVVNTAYTHVQAERARQMAERLRNEIDAVRKLQESVIPRELPEVGDYRIAARYEPAQIHVEGESPVVLAGGDYYDVFRLDEDTVVLLVGDAAGHGIKACMSIMTMHTLIRMIRDRRHEHTGQFVTEVNSNLAGNDVVQDEGGFITLMYCSLNTTLHQLHFTSAGHPMPLLQNLETNEVRPLGGEDNAELPLAIEDDVVYEEFISSIPRNSRVLIYTDGLAEAFPVGGDASDQFGEDGIIRSLRETRELPLQEALERLFDDSLAYTGGHGRHDDTSVLLLERT